MGKLSISAKIWVKLLLLFGLFEAFDATTLLFRSPCGNYDTMRGARTAYEASAEATMVSENSVAKKDASYRTEKKKNAFITNLLLMRVNLTAQ